MKRVNEWIIILVLVTLGFLLSGCGPSTQSGVNKVYDMRADASGNSTINLNVTLDATTAAEVASGDADANQTVEGRLTAAWDAAQAQGIEEGNALIEAVKNWVDKKYTPDHSTDVIQPDPTPAPDPTPIPIPDPEPDDDVVIDDDMTVNTYKCEDLGFTYRDDTEGGPGNGVPQLVCTFTDYDSCEQIPAESFTMVWKDADGGFAYLEVPDRCNIAMDTKENGYGKFRPAHDKEPFKPVAYAPREFDAVEVDLVKKQ